MAACTTCGGGPHYARGFCAPCYRKWRRRTIKETGGNPPAGRGPVQAPYQDRPDPADKIAYLSSLTEGELGAYCAGVLSRASVVPGDPEEIQQWMELVRLTARRESGSAPVSLDRPQRLLVAQRVPLALPAPPAQQAVGDEEQPEDEVPAADDAPRQ